MIALGLGTRLHEFCFRCGGVTLPDAEPADRAPPMCVPFTALQLLRCRTGWPPRVSDFTADGLLFKTVRLFFAQKVNLLTLYKLLISSGVRSCSLNDGFFSCISFTESNVKTILDDEFENVKKAAIVNYLRILYQHLHEGT